MSTNDRKARTKVVESHCTKNRFEKQAKSLNKCKTVGWHVHTRRKLIYLDEADELQDIRAVPGHRLETLRGNRAGQYSIRINDQWRICFKWRKPHAHDVEIVDYH